jgi:hypothetical protein
MNLPKQITCYGSTQMMTMTTSGKGANQHHRDAPVAVHDVLSWCFLLPSGAFRSLSKVGRQERRNASSAVAKTPRRCWIQFPGIRCPDCGTWRSSTRCLRLRPCQRSSQNSKVDDYYHKGARRRLRLHKKAARSMISFCITCSSGYWTNNIVVAGLQSGQPLFQSVASVGADLPYARLSPSRGLSAPSL